MLQTVMIYPSTGAFPSFLYSRNIIAMLCISFHDTNFFFTLYVPCISFVCRIIIGFPLPYSSVIVINYSEHVIKLKIKAVIIVVAFVNINIKATLVRKGTIKRINNQRTNNIILKIKMK